MRISTIAIGTAAAAAMIASGAGFAAASTSAVHRPAASGTEHFSLMTTQPSASKYVVIASGLFTAGGVDISGNTVDLVRLPAGTFKINHGSALHLIREKLNPQTCLMEFAATAKFKLEDGTRGYKGISGSGKALISAVGIARRTHGQCNPNANALDLEQTITATGHVRL